MIWTPNFGPQDQETIWYARSNATCVIFGISPIGTPSRRERRINWRRRRLDARKSMLSGPVDHPLWKEISGRFGKGCR